MLNQDIHARLDGRRVVASISGGKDSAAMSLWLTEQGIEHDRVFMDTGWEHALTYEYLRGPLTAKIGPITEIRGPLLMEDLIRKKGMFPSRVRRFCTQLLKMKPMQEYLAARDDAVVNTVGIRAGESAARAKMCEWEWSEGFDCEVWRPLLAWTERDVIDMHTRHGLRPNPLYLMGAERVGCWPCIFARKSEIRLIADKDPERIALIRALEKESSDAARRRYAERGETFESLGYQPPTFFHSHSKNGGMKWTPIDEAVDWSRTARGGRQRELFVDEQQGCMRWGLCDTTSEESVIGAKS